MGLLVDSVNAAKTVVNDRHLETLTARWPYLVFLMVFGLLYRFSQREKYQKKHPDVPWLRLSSLPGAAGEKEDIEAYVRNGHEVICAGYEKVCTD